MGGDVLLNQPGGLSICPSGGLQKMSGANFFYVNDSYTYEYQ